MPDWLWKRDLNKKDSDESAWAPFEFAARDKAELAYQKSPKNTKFKLNSTYSLDFVGMLQFQTSDWDRQRPIKRVLSKEESQKGGGKEDSTKGGN